VPLVDYDPHRDTDTDLFALLGTEWAADPAVVRRAWRTASQTTHPDAGGSHDTFIRMQHAWEVLADATRRTRYVRAYEARHGPQRRHEPDRRPPCTPRDRGRTAPPPPGPPRSPTPPPTAPAGTAPPPGGTPPPGSPPSPRPSYAMPRRPPPTVPRRRSRHRVVGAAATVSLALIVTAVAGIAHWWSQPRAIGFAEDIKATSATCSSDEPIAADDVLRGFDLTCTMVDGAPVNGDRPYVQVRLDGCDDWQRLDHDDGPAAVTISTRLAPCGTDPAALEWQVCQTHGGLLPDDCDDGTTDLPSR